MAHPNNNIPSLLSIVLTLSCLLSPRIEALEFTFPTFESNPTDIEMEGDAHYIRSSIYLSSPKENSTGRALYHEPMQLWEVDGTTTRLADFSTNFSFTISQVPGYGASKSGHGLAFVLLRENSTLSNNSIGGWLGLFESDEAAADSHATTNYVVAVEFDTFKNTWDETQYHAGIDVNSLRSKEYINVPNGFIDRGIVNVWVVYDSTTKNLSASLAFAGPESPKSYDVSYIIDLSTVLPQRVRVGFTAATRTFVETHELNSWSFKSTIGGTSDAPPSPPQGPPTAPKSPP